MAISFDTSILGNGTANLTLTTTAITVGANAKIAILSFRSGIDSTGATFGGQTMIKAGSTDTQSNGLRVTVYYIMNPPTGSQTAAITFASTDDLWYVIETFNGVDTTGIDEYQAVTSGTLGAGGGSLSITYTGGVANEWATVYAQCGTLTPTITGTPYTQRGTNASPPREYGDSGAPISGSTTYTWSTAGTNGVLGGISFKAAAAVTTRTLPFMHAG